MKTIPPAIATILEGHVYHFATCWKITRKDGVILGFTDHVEDLVVDGVTYYAKSGYSRTALQSSGNLAVDNMDLEGLVQNAAITEADCRAGKYDYADLLMFMVNYQSPSGGTVILKRGKMGELSLKDGIFVCEVRGLSQMLTRQFLKIVTPECNAELFDSRCQVAITDGVTRFSGSVTTLTAKASEFDVTLPVYSPQPATGKFDRGKITFTSGNNNGLTQEVRTHVNTAGVHSLKLYLAMPLAVQVGDTFNIFVGCDKTLDTCYFTFSNELNFQGFPFVPGDDKVTLYAEPK